MVHRLRPLLVVRACTTIRSYLFVVQAPTSIWTCLGLRCTPSVTNVANQRVRIRHKADTDTMKAAALVVVACVSTLFAGPFDRRVCAYDSIDGDAADEVEVGDDDDDFDFVSSTVRARNSECISICTLTRNIYPLHLQICTLSISICTLTFSLCTPLSPSLSCLSRILDIIIAARPCQA